MFKSTNLSFLLLAVLCLADLGQSKSVSQHLGVTANSGENAQGSNVDAFKSVPLSRARRSYFWVEDGSDKVTVVENKNLRRTLEDYRHKVHAAEKQREERHRAQYEERREEYGEDEEVQEHTPLFVPNLFG
ncbi:uncharacterized protein LOC105215222 [Zeugodacus cucurbitae]|uniref:ABC transporter C family member 5 n=1 Tax=Zeugodacus cucurbitae TaxID=28588 RepID=A0A0A1XLT1_ZEUCU|nr:uncharacterized protein LOC105215222 [Zeugodacus cucurbitae]